MAATWHSPEERLEGAGLIPAHQEFRIGVPEEAADVSAAEGDARKAEAHHHGEAGGEVAPVGGVVACPHGAVALGASEEGAREDKRSLVVVGA